MGGMLGDILLDRGHLTKAQLATALQSKSPGQMLGDCLMTMGLVTPERLGSALSEQFEVDYSDFDPQSVNLQVVRLLPESFLRSRQAVPVLVSRNRMTLAMVSPDDIEAIAEAELITGYHIDAVIALTQTIEDTLNRAFDERSLARQTAVDVKLDDLKSHGNNDQELNVAPLDEDEEAPVVRLVHAILAGAANAKGSDIHLEPHQPEMRVRYRVDGELQQVMTIPSHIENAVIARIKVMADMNTTETRRPQDGQLSIHDNGRRVSFRVSSIPTIGGEKMVLRLLDEGSKTFSMEQLGFSESEEQRVRSMLDKPYGMLVVTGPTGSGKSTTLYAALSQLNRVQRNIVTVEDPVEYQLAGINQVKADNDFGMGFANALKFIMRQDPDVIMVGEIRDQETASTAVQAALTGHLLLSTLHTNDAIGAVTRLKDLGIDAFKIGGALIGCVAQRLLRNICPFCKEEASPSPILVKKLAEHYAIPSGAVFYQGRGCSKCLSTGFSGRTPVFEIFVVTPEIAEAIDRSVPATQLRELAKRDGMVDLIGAGVEKALQGKTSLEEVYFKTLG